MQRYTGYAIAKFDDNTTGNVIASASVEVRKVSDNSLATLYQIDNTGGSTFSNPLTTDSNGKFYFYASSDDRYTLTVSKSGTTIADSTITDVLLFDPADSASIGLKDGSAASPSIHFSDDTDTGLYRVGANNIGISVNGTKVLDANTTRLLNPNQLVNEGQVAIGTNAVVGGTELTVYGTGADNLCRFGTPTEGGVVRVGLGNKTYSTAWDTSDAALYVGHDTASGRSANFSGDVDINGTVDASAAGIYLGANSSANLLDDYEEGTWTVADASGAGLTFTDATGSYTKIGRLVTCIVQFSFPSTADGTSSLFGGLPFTVGGDNDDRGAVSIGFCNASTSLGGGLCSNSATSFALYEADNQTQATNADLSAATIFLTIQYYV